MRTRPALLGDRGRWGLLLVAGVLTAACLLPHPGGGKAPSPPAPEATTAGGQTPAPPAAAAEAPAATRPAAAQVRYEATDAGSVPDRWLEASRLLLAAAPDRRPGLAREWWDRVRRQGTPWPEAGRLYFFYWGEARQVAVSSEVTRWQPVALTRLPGTDLWAGSLAVPSDAVFLYRLVVDGRGQHDPLNPLRSHNLGVLWSVYRGPQAPGEEPPANPPGMRRETWFLFSQALGRVVRLEAWIPPECTDRHRCPALVAADGPSYLNEARLPGIVAGLAAGGRTPPLVVVGIRPPDHPLLRLVELVPGIRAGAWPRFVGQELLPDLARRLPVSSGPHGLVGLSAGAAAMLEVLLTYPDRFAWAVLQSPAGLSPVLEEAIGRARPAGNRIWLTWGSYEENVFGIDVRIYAAGLARRLSERGFVVAGGERPAGHTLVFWRRDLTAALTWALEGIPGEVRSATGR